VEVSNVQIPVYRKLVKGLQGISTAEDKMLVEGYGE
jgi:hypothetical protein